MAKSGRGAVLFAAIMSADHRRVVSMIEALIAARGIENLRKKKTSKSLFSELAQSYDALGRPYDAIWAFREAVKLDPTDELISIALFHRLLGIGEVDEAFEEAKRLVSLRYSDLYQQFIDGINRSQ